MIITYNLMEEAEDDDFFICEGCGTVANDVARLDTEKRQVALTVPGCYGEFTDEYPFPEFLDEFESNQYEWPEEPFNTLISDIKELLK